MIGSESEADRAFAMVAHDVRSALSGIVGGLTQIDRSALASRDLAQIERIEASGRMLATLLDDVLALAALAGRDIETEPEEFSLRDILLQTEQRWRGQAEAESVRFELLADMPDGLAAFLSPGHLERILGNFISNAIKYTGPHGRVELVAKYDEAEGLTLSVLDDGPGLTPDAQARLFSYKGRPENASKPGTGLGLFISRQLADEIGATVSGGNRAEGGACFELKLPSSILFDAGADGSAEQLPDLSHLHILVAEDNVTNQLVVTQMLQTLGASYDLVDDGSEALHALARNCYNLALLDIEMPRKSGLEVIEAVRSGIAGRADLPLVALTAYALAEHRDQIMSAGANGLIPKPLMSVADLGSSILGFVGGRRQPESRRAPAGQSAEAATGVAPELLDRAIFDALLAAICSEGLAEFTEKVASDLAEISNGLSNGISLCDFAAVRKHTHVLISVAGAVGASPLHLAAREINIAAHEGDRQTVERLGRRAVADIARLRRLIQIAADDCANPVPESARVG